MGNHKQNPKLKNKWRKKGEGGGEEGHGRVWGFSKCKRLKKVRVPIKHERPMTIEFQTPLKNKIKQGKKKLTKEKGNWGKWLGLGFDGCDKYEELEASEDIFSFSNFFLKEKGREMLNVS